MSSMMIMKLLESFADNFIDTAQKNMSNARRKISIVVAFPIPMLNDYKTWTPTRENEIAQAGIFFLGI